MILNFCSFLVLLCSITNAYVVFPNQARIQRSSQIFALKLEEEKRTLTYGTDGNLKARNNQQQELPQLASPTLVTVEESDTETDEIDIIEGNGLVWRGVVVILCALWASNFPAIKLIVGEPGVDSLLFAVARFTTAVMALAPFCLRQLGSMNPETIRGAAICGSWVAFGYLGQLIGLLTTTASRSCVICSLHCVFVAALAEFGRSQIKQSFDWTRLAPAAVAVAGVALVELKGAGGAPSIGDLLSFAQPIGFGMGYLQLEELMKKDPGAALPVSAIKLFMVACASLLFFEIKPLLDGGMPSLPDFGPILASPLALSGVLYTGLITTAAALWAESVAFRRVPATDASIILTTEPLFAAALGAAFVGETFGASDYVGAGLIIGACVLAVLNGESEASINVAEKSS